MHSVHAILIAGLAATASAVPSSNPFLSPRALTCPATEVSCSSDSTDSCCVPDNGILVVSVQWLTGFCPSNSCNINPPSVWTIPGEERRGGMGARGRRFWIADFCRRSKVFKFKGGSCESSLTVLLSFFYSGLWPDDCSGNQAGNYDESRQYMAPSGLQSVALQHPQAGLALVQGLVLVRLRWILVPRVAEA
ncbi:hypothetical protein BDK51DRAFT_31534 [Blyttiomyces helicus]|uniref:Uncharacterized protein n=1 Tax=Blyttiomyces helicus TaxID=388810 RepID=A0A4P9WCM5_9FUNG|nr:hypothetical protein BDK51DRAFT_31534 [Blyttiomyces helicus]|eukprot:RKO90419.1 hypothetical protein BDK51DRAFT_31534 [Blyttiomyces helicus]